MELLGLGSTYGANLGARAAFRTSVLIDNDFAVLFGYATYGTFVYASAACNAIISDNICHSKHLLSYNSIIQQTY